MLNNPDKLIELNGQKLVKKSPWPKVLTMLSITLFVFYIFYKSQPNFDWGIFSDLLKYFGDRDDIELGFGNKITIGDTIVRSFSLLTDTLAFSLLGTLFGLLVAIPLSLLASKNVSKNWFIYQPVRWIASIVRSVPPLIYASILYYLFDGPLSATISLTFFVSSITIKWLYEWLDTTNFDTYEALISMGLSKPRAISKAILPELMKKVVSYGLYAFEMVIRFATILSVVGVQTIGYLMSVTYKEHDRWGHLLIVIAVLISTIIIIELLTVVIKRYILSPVLKQATLDKAESIEEQIIALNTQRSKSYIYQRIALVILGAIIIFSLTRVNFSLAPEGRLDQFKAGIRDLFDPRWEIITDWNAINAIKLSIEALIMAGTAAVFGAILGLIFGIFASVNITGKISSWFFKLLIISVRSVPTFVYAFIFVLAAHENKIWVGVLAMGIRSIGMLGKLTYEKIESTDMGGKISMDVMGNNVYNSTRIAVISEAIPAIIANMLYRVEINFKSVVEIGAVGASTLGFQIIVNSEPARYSYLTPYILVIIVFVLAVEQVSTILRKKVMTGYFVSANNMAKVIYRQHQVFQSIKAAALRGVSLPISSMSQEYLRIETAIMMSDNPELKEKYIALSNEMKVYFSEQKNNNLFRINEMVSNEVEKISEIKSAKFINNDLLVDTKKYKKQLQKTKRKTAYKNALESTIKKFTN